MASPYFQLKVLSKTDVSIHLHIVLADDLGGGFDTDKRTVLKVLGFGSDYLGTGEDSQSYLEEHISFDELWDDNWVEENAHQFYNEANIYWEHNHPCEKWTAEQYHELKELMKSDTFPANLFEPLNGIPQCKCKITVTRPEIISHLKPNLIFVYY